jgi:hypothetical protein
MGSVLDFVICPQCKTDKAMSDCYYKTLKLYVS